MDPVIVEVSDHQIRFGDRASESGRGDTGASGNLEHAPRSVLADPQGEHLGHVGEEDRAHALVVEARHITHERRGVVNTLERYPHFAGCLSLILASLHCRPA